MKTTEYKYWAFISYSHQDNLAVRGDGSRDHIAWANWLHEQLETFRIPDGYRDRLTATGEPIPKRFFPAFRDEAELPTGHDLGSQIRDALRSSRFLIVIASPRSARSHYVSEEVRFFRQLGRGNRVLTLIVDGEPNVHRRPKAGWTAADDCFCPALVHPLRDDGRIDKSALLPEEPIAADVRVKDIEPPREMCASERDSSSRHALLDFMKLKLIAGLMGVGLDELVQRDKVRQLDEARQRAKKLRRWLVAVTVLTLLAAGGGLIAWKQKQIATTKGREAIDNYATAQRNQALAEKNATAAAEQAELAQKNANTANENENDAKRQAEKAKRTLSVSDFYRANEMIATGKQPDALAFLARSLLGDPHNFAAARRAIMLLQEQPWFLPRNPPSLEKQFEVHDVRFIDCEHCLYLVSNETGIGVCDETGTPLHPLRSRQGNPGSGYADFSFGFTEDARAYYTEVEGSPRRYWDSRTGQISELSAAQQDVERRLNELSRKFRDRSSGVERNSDTVVLSPRGKKAAILCVSRDEVLVTNLANNLDSPLHYDKELGCVAIFDPLSEELAMGGGIQFEYDCWGAINVPKHKIRHQLELPCVSLRFFPAGHVFASADTLGRVHLWDMEGAAFGEMKAQLLHPAGDGPVSFNSGLDIAPDGKSIISRRACWRALGQRPLIQVVGENAAGQEVREAEEKVQTNWSRREELENEAGRIAGRVGGLVVDTARNYVAIRFEKEIEVWSISPQARIGRFTPVTGNYNSMQGLPSIRPDGLQILVSNEGYSAQLWDVHTGEPVGPELRAPKRYVSHQFSPDGSFFVTMADDSGSGTLIFQIWDTATQLPLSRTWSSNEMLVGDPFSGHGGPCGFGAGGRFFLTASESLEDGRDGRTLFYPFEFPDPAMEVPDWFPELLEATGGRHVAENNGVVDIPDQKRRDCIARIRTRLAPTPNTDRWAAILRWWLDEGPQRLVSPGSDQTVESYVAARKSRGRMLDLEAAMRATPNDADIYERLATVCQREINLDENKRRTSSINVEARLNLYTRLCYRFGKADVIPPLAQQEDLGKTGIHDVVSPANMPATKANAFFAQGEAAQQGNSGAKDLAAALTAYRQAAALGHAGAMHRLGVMYARGEGVTKDETLAIAWYSKSAALGFAEAQHDLGVRYILGRGVQKDERVGIEWYRKAAAQGYEEAIKALKRRGY